jgi:hypothetical protein
MGEWRRTDQNYTQRVAHLKTGGGLNGSTVLVYATNVFDDGSADILSGGSHSDWFFAANPGDTLLDRLASETLN